MTYKDAGIKLNLAVCKKTGGLTLFACCIYYCYTFINNYAGNYVIIWESFQIMLPGTVVAFCGRILAPGSWNLQMSWCKCPGVPRGQFPGMATDRCITSRPSQIPTSAKFVT